MWGIGDPTHFDLFTIEQLICVLRSVKQFEDVIPQCTKTRRSDCSLLWDQISSCISNVMSELSLDEINTGKRFPHLVHLELQRNYKEMNTTLKSISSSLIGRKGRLSIKTTDDSDVLTTYHKKERTQIGTEGVEITMNQISEKLVKRVWCPFVKSGKTRRRYNLSKDKKTLHMEWDARAPKPESATKMVNQKPTQKRLRSGNRDLIIVI